MANVSKVLQCALVVLSLATSGISLHFASNLHEVRVDRGNSINLQCILGGDSSHGGSFSWRGPAVSSDRAVIELDISGTVSSLTINSVGRSDEGRYFCSYSGVGEVSILLDVQLPPHFLNVSEYQEFIEGTDAVVECPAFLGDPPGDMIWTRDNALITNDRFTLEDGQMRIQNIQENDEGVYRCSINRLGIVDSRFITVDVLERSELAPRIVEPMNPLEVMYGDPLELICRLEVQRDDVQYTWTVDTEFEDDVFQNTTPSIQRDAYRFLGGFYTCRAEDEYGYDQQIFFVRILAPPEPTICSESDKIRNEGETVVLRPCEFTSPVQLSELNFQWSRRSGDRLHVWMKIRHDGRFRINYGGFLTMSNVQPSDSGLYQVNISNNQGYALHMVQLEVTGSLDAHVTLRLRFQFSGSGDSDGSCQEIQEMEDLFTNALLKAICDRLETCSEEADIGLRESTIICPNSDSKIGTFSATLSGPNVTKLVESIEQLSEDLAVDLGSGFMLTLSACDDNCPMPLGEPIRQVQSSGLVAGVVISVIILVAVVIAAAILLTVFKYRCLPEREIVHADDHHLHVMGLSVQSSQRISIPGHLIISATKIQLAESIGQGEFGIVYKGYIVNSDIVAIKTLKGFYDHSTVEVLLKECFKMKDLNHPNVLKLVGVCLDGGPAPFIITPFMENGSLLSYLKKNRSTLLPTEDDANPVLKQLMDMLLQVAKGMEYLASVKIIHRDLAARNCMMGINSVIKVADFGLAETLGNKDYFRQDKTVIVKLPLRWLAPESLEDQIFSEKSDVWAYGVTCWEIFSGGKVPYPGVNVTELLWLLKHGQHLDRPENSACNDHMYSFMLQCWRLEPHKRPPFSELVQSLSLTLETMAEYIPLCKETSI